MDDPREPKSIPAARPSSVRIRPEIAAMATYKPGKAAEGGFKLSSNENPFPPLPSVLGAVQLAAEDLNRYPDASAAEVVARLAALDHVAEDQVLVGPGSIAVLQQLLTSVAGRGDEIVYAWRSFEGYPLVVTITGATGVTVPLDGRGRHDLDAMLDAITERTRAVLLCSPNNPTGTVLTRAEVEHFVAQVPDDVLVVLDEAYVEFVRDPDVVDGIALVADHPNVVTVRTLSKAFGLAGLRVGYAIGAPDVVAAGRAAGLPFALNTLALAAAAASLDAREELDRQVAEIVDRRNRIEAGLVAQGWPDSDPQGNFVWLPTGERTEWAVGVLAEHGITARPFHPEGIRVSIGEVESIEPLLAATAEIVENL